MERNKIIRKKTIKSIFMVDCIFILLFIVAFGPWPWNDEIGKSHQIIATIIIIIAIVIGNILLWFLLQNTYSTIVELKESSTIVEKQIEKYKEVEIIPIRDDPSIRILKEYSKFYATYDGDEVLINIKVKDNEKQYFESINKKYFTFYYKLK